MQLIINPPSGHYYEHHVSTWAFTKVKEVFSAEHWAITGEKTDEYSGMKPDIVVELANSDLTLSFHMGMELKKMEGARMESALSQLNRTMRENMDNAGFNNPTKYRTFLVVQAGCYIGFFEYHQDMDEDHEIENFQGCVSLTQPYWVKDTGKYYPAVLEPPTDGHATPIDHLFFNYSKLKKMDDLRREASKYTVPCIFHIYYHPAQIHYLFNHIKSSRPRGIRYVL